MANRRMFSLDVIDTDAFLDMPAAARLLYYDLGMRADASGVVRSPNAILRMTGADACSLELLISKGFAQRTADGVSVRR